MLGRVRTHLQPDDAAGILDMATAQYHILVMQALRTQGHTAMYFTILAVLHKDVLTRATIGIFISPSALSAFQYNGIVIHAHITP